MTDLWLKNSWEALGSVSVGVEHKKALRRAATVAGLSMRVALGLVVRGAPDLEEIRDQIRKWYPGSAWGDNGSKVSSVPVGDDRIAALKRFCVPGPDNFSPGSVAGAIFRAAVAGEIEIEGQEAREVVRAAHTFTLNQRKGRRR